MRYFSGKEGGGGGDIQIDWSLIQSFSNFWILACQTDGVCAPPALLRLALRYAARTQAGSKPSAGIKKQPSRRRGLGEEEKKKPRRCAENPGQAAGIGGGLFPGRD